MGQSLGVLEKKEQREVHLEGSQEEEAPEGLASWGHFLRVRWEV